jgi:hypothetical protein
MTAEPLDLRTVQRQLWANKVAKGFNLTDVPLEFCLLQGEVAEAFDAWRKDPARLPGELADVVLYVAALAEMTGIDLQSAVAEKLAVNRARVYVRDERSGVLVKAGETS